MGSESPSVTPGFKHPYHSSGGGPMLVLQIGGLLGLWSYLSPVSPTLAEGKTVRDCAYFTDGRREAQHKDGTGVRSPRAWVVEPGLRMSRPGLLPIISGFHHNHEFPGKEQEAHG